jgi:hypothetical protein
MDMETSTRRHGNIAWRHGHADMELKVLGNSDVLHKKRNQTENGT